MDVTPDARAAADRFAQELVALDVESNTFRGKLRQLETIGRGGLLASTQLCAGIAGADRSAETRRTTARIKRDAQRLARLAQGLVPGDARARDGYFERFDGAETELREALATLAGSLAAGRGLRLGLERDIKSLATVRLSLEHDAMLAAALEEALSVRSAALPEDLLVAVRRRRTDLLLQVTVVDQALTGLRSTAVTAQGLVAALERARLETLHALQTVALAARPLLSQAAMVDRVAAEANSMLILLGAADGEAAGAAHGGLGDPWLELRLAWRRVEAAAAAIRAL